MSSHITNTSCSKTHSHQRPKPQLYITILCFDYDLGYGLNHNEITIGFCYSFAGRFDIEAQCKTNVDDRQNHYQIRGYAQSSGVSD